MPHIQNQYQGAIALLLVAGIDVSAAANETVTLNDGTTCTVIETTGSGGIGQVTSSTTLGGHTTTTQSGSGTSSSSSAGSSVTSGSVGTHAFSTASVVRPDGSVVTRRSDGTCDISKLKP